MFQETISITASSLHQTTSMMMMTVKLGLRSQIMCLMLWVLVCGVRLNTISCCHVTDRSLLLMFKEGVVDPSNRLSSWSSLHDCCKWRGVSCDDNNRVDGLVLSDYNSISEPLSGEINLSSLLSLQCLEMLGLDYNDFARISIPSINNSAVATHHGHLLLNSSSMLSTSLYVLSLSYNIHLHIDNFHHLLSLLPSLEYLDLNGIQLPSESNWVQSLALLPLRTLILYDCNLTSSSVSSLQYANFSSLSYVDLGHNDFRYGLPNWLFNLSKGCSHLCLNQSNLEGQFPDFSGYRNMLVLDLSNNKLEGTIPDWLGQQDHLEDLYLSNNSFHGSIPSSLLNASFWHLDISFNDLSDTLPKNFNQSSFDILNLSHNSIGGDISNLLLNGGSILFMSFNKFKGRLPRVSDEVIALDLSYNSFSGSLSSLLCQSKTNHSDLGYLDLSNNYLTQQLPDCWDNWRDLFYINLGNNQLVGQIPSSMGSLLNHLRSLDLRNNGFSGDMPWTFHKSTSLVLLNLEGNNFSGSIHAWMPKSVLVLKLRSNLFTGNIPPQLCSLSNLIVLDLANNKFSGSIPHCLFNIISFSSAFLENNQAFKLSFSFKSMPDSHQFMKIDLQIKGRQLEYEKNLKLVRSIDLSGNKLSGEIPVQLFKLTKLQSLNLSYNYLIGEIPQQIGEMRDLESLDVSHNNLQGNIPQTVSDLSFLSDLNISYNNFSGQIPLGTQLQSFEAWSYTGNPELCGPPLQKNCTVQEKPDNTEHVERNDNDDFSKSLYLGMGVGFAVGFWVISGSLFLNRTWRHAYFRFFDCVVDRIYVIVAIKLRRFS